MAFKTCAQADAQPKAQPRGWPRVLFSSVWGLEAWRSRRPAPADHGHSSSTQGVGGRRRRHPSVSGDGGQPCQLPLCFSFSLPSCVEGRRVSGAQCLPAASLAGARVALEWCVRNGEGDALVISGFSGANSVLSVSAACRDFWLLFSVSQGKLGMAAV